MADLTFLLEDRSDVPREGQRVGRRRQGSERRGASRSATMR
jgi:hypothetical protein